MLLLVCLCFLKTTEAAVATIIITKTSIATAVRLDVFFLMNLDMQDRVNDHAFSRKACIDHALQVLIGKNQCPVWTAVQQSL